LTTKEMIERIAPCGIDCGRCAFFSAGPVKRASRELSENLRGFEHLAQAMSEAVPALGKYADFAAVLEFLTQGRCDGCRAGGQAGFPGCRAKTCVQEQDAAFCHECARFPCEDNRYPPSLKQRWLENNLRIREKGLEAFFQEQLEKPRYG
jgi:hypothetical protein